MEERQRQARLIRQWKPWDKSTGAKTKEGKQRSSQNAYKHGGRAQDFIQLCYLLKCLLSDTKHTISHYKALVEAD